MYTKSSNNYNDKLWARYTIININLRKTSFPERPAYLSCTTHTRRIYTLDNLVCLPNLSNKEGINI